MRAGIYSALAAAASTALASIEPRDGHYHNNHPSGRLPGYVPHLKSQFIPGHSSFFFPDDHQYHHHSQRGLPHHDHGHILELSDDVAKEHEKAREHGHSEVGFFCSACKFEKFHKECSRTKEWVHEECCEGKHEHERCIPKPHCPPKHVHHETEEDEPRRHHHRPEKHGHHKTGKHGHLGHVHDHEQEKHGPHYRESKKYSHHEPHHDYESQKHFHPDHGHHHETQTKHVHDHEQEKNEPHHHESEKHAHHEPHHDREPKKHEELHHNRNPCPTGTCHSKRHHHAIRDEQCRRRRKNKHNKHNDLECEGTFVKAFGPDRKTLPFRDLADRLPESCSREEGFFHRLPRSDLDFAVRGPITYRGREFGFFTIELDKTKDDATIIIKIDVEDVKFYVAEIAIFLECDGGRDKDRNICRPETYPHRHHNERGIGQFKFEIADNFKCPSDYFIAIYLRVCIRGEKGCHRGKHHKHRPRLIG